MAAGPCRTRPSVLFRAAAPARDGPPPQKQPPLLDLLSSDRWPSSSLARHRCLSIGSNLAGIIQITVGHNSTVSQHYARLPFILRILSNRWTGKGHALRAVHPDFRASMLLIFCSAERCDKTQSVLPLSNLEVELIDEVLDGSSCQRPVACKVVPFSALIAQHKVKLFLDLVAWDKRPSWARKQKLASSLSLPSPPIPSACNFRPESRQSHISTFEELWETALRPGC